MSRRRRVLSIVVVLVALGLAAGAWFFRPIAATATGYAARVLCGGHFVSGQPVETVAQDLPGNPLVPLLRYDVDASAGTLEASILGLYGTTARHHDGYGCTLGDDVPDLPSRSAPVTQDADPWPDGSRLGPVPPGVDLDAIEAAMDVAFDESAEEGTKTTKAIAVVTGGRLVAERYATGLDADSPLLGWSATKSIGNAIIGRLVQEGVLSVEDRGLLPAWEADGRAEITLDDLLHMRSGLDFDEVYDVGTDATTMLFTPVDVSDFAASKPLRNEPGTEWYYSSGTSNIVCQIAQDASGLGPEMPRELVFDPLGMSSALIEVDPTGDPICSSFGYATAHDWARFGQWFLQDGVWDGERLLPEGWVEYSTTPVELPTENPYGAHWWLNEGPDGTLRMPSIPADAYWASGFQGQHVVVIPSRDTVVVRLGAAVDFDGIDWGLEPLLRDILTAIG